MRTLKAVLPFFVLGLFLAPPAFSYTISFSGQAALDGSKWTSPEAWASVWTFNSGNLSGSRPLLFDSIVGSFNAAVVSGSVDGQYAAPGKNDTTYYLSVPAPSPAGSSGSITVDLATETNNYFGLYWGSIDSYNSITFYKNEVPFLTLTGTNVVGSANANGNQIALGSNTYVNFYDLDPFDRFTLTSTNRAFEVDNIAVGTAPVPEPATMLLFGAGLASLAGIQLRRKR